MSDGGFMRYPPATPTHAAGFVCHPLAAPTHAVALEDVFVSLTGRHLRDV